MLVSGSDFEKDPVAWAANAQRDIERLGQRQTQGSNDGNADAYPVTQQTRRENQQLFMPLTIPFGQGNTVTLSANDFAGLVGMDIQWRVVSICVNGTAMRMLVLASQPFV